MFSFEVKGNWERTERFLKRASTFDIRTILEEGGRDGVKALRETTPVDTGLAQAGWAYDIFAVNGVYGINWKNMDIENGFQVVLRLQYGHATGTGGYVQGRDIINPAIKPVFDRISDRVWKAVKSL